MLTLLLTATLAHVLLSTLRRRTGDLAILHAMGYVRSQMAATLRWQTIVLTGTAVVIGVPLGLLGNQFAWRAFTHQFGISPGTVLPIAAGGHRNDRDPDGRVVGRHDRRPTRTTIRAQLPLPGLSTHVVEFNPHERVDSVPATFTDSRRGDAPTERRSPSLQSALSG